MSIKQIQMPPTTERVPGLDGFRGSSGQLTGAGEYFMHRRLLRRKIRRTLMTDQNHQERHSDGPDGWQLAPSSRRPPIKIVF